MFGAVRDHGTFFFEIAEQPEHDDGSALPRAPNNPALLQRMRAKSKPEAPTLRFDARV